MWVTDEHGNELFIGQFTIALTVPSGKAGINFDSNSAFNINTLILNCTLTEFVIEWNRTH